MVDVFGRPLQPFDIGVTVMVAVISTLELLTAVNDAISPCPLPANPMDVILFVQL